MKKWIIIVLIIAALGFYGVSKSNQMVRLKGAAEKEWADVESSYQRRADLISNLVKTVQGAADFERGTLTQVIEARAKATSVNVDATNLTPEAISQFQQAQEGLTSALSRLLVTVERYPDLKANQNFLQLQSQIEGTENRINVERNQFNEAATAYNIYVEVFPNSMIASLTGKAKMPLFKAQEGADKAPEVNFDFK
ncbi:LemA family protein [Capnocytophaga catalasegens]|uniref:LemA family protein n=1 Tax=Capnocytophaga catalasegens TaxID=1004260 RepID=A0AAV5AZH0_9FLAO|nr:LemA family protein [Capnocytophaga catalasegens]GIZ16563.1 hypothetical protein RCZ03_25630 [Capnocytophaga catalasegens]GJM51395.1 hypothetical protein RCZ15_23680 [Capnocytophaga catalasegens]GJM54299.1 hypothetical protein RCZ16_26150 [Capnocytophaga catalasegens]